MILDNKVFSSFDHNYLSMSISKKKEKTIHMSISKIKTIHISRHYQHQNINLSCLLHLILRCHLQMAHRF